ncbi:MAG: VCBS repeat-containing protein [Reichenbachiella sp.]|uniref:FG-GAP repeat domain-containing protein n=1 Tax=Reichenbachiella sp. TaxID=2184521 RepID=UPI003264AF04
MKYINIKFFVILTMAGFNISCSDDEESDTIDLSISPSTNANTGSSYTHANHVDIQVSYFFVPSGDNTGDLRDAIAYIDANGDGHTDVFMATGEFQLQGEVNSILAINDGAGNFSSSTSEFGDNMPPATHARKSIVSDFNGDGLDDIFVFDHGFDSDPFPGSNPKLIIQNAVGSFSWSKLLDQTGFHHGGASADIDNDGDVDVFVGGNEPFFYVNDGNANFEMVTDRFDRSIQKIFSAELIDVDEDGFVDLLAGAHEHDGDETSIYWGSSTGSYTNNLRTVVPATSNYGTVLDFDAEDFDKDGDRDLLINRTGGGNNNFYVGSRIQLLMNDGNRTFSDKTSQIDNPGSDTDDWFPWLRAQDADSDGDIDFFPDDSAFGFKYLNDGSGNFTRTQ